jgi:hypothetical protein
MLRTLSILAVTVLFVSACGKSCEEKLTDYTTYSSAWADAWFNGNCAGLEAAYPNLLSAYNNLCEEEKAMLAETGVTSADDITLAHNNSLESLECE